MTLVYIYAYISIVSIIILYHWYLNVY